jgi:glutaminase
MVLSKDQILSAPDTEYETVDVPEWGGKVRVKTLTGDERDSYEQSLIDQRGNVTGPKLAGAQARLCALTIVDDDGKRLFTDGDVKALGAKSAQALNRVFDVAIRLSRMTQKDVEELVGNSDGTQADASIST